MSTSLTQADIDNLEMLRYSRTGTIPAVVARCTQAHAEIVRCKPAVSPCALLRGRSMNQVAAAAGDTGTASAYVAGIDRGL